MISYFAKKAVSIHEILSIVSLSVSNWLFRFSIDHISSKSLLVENIDGKLSTITSVTDSGVNSVFF